MAARTPRRSFATPFVVTLAAVPACYVQSGPSQPQPPPQTAQPAEPPPSTNQPPPPVVVNPPRPAEPPPTQPSTPAPPTPPPTQGSQEQKWTVYKAKDGCMAAIKVECQPKATCNPPPPFKYTCPENVSLEKPVTVATYDGNSCFVEFEMPKCPPGVACNPPRPQPVTCPKR